QRLITREGIPALNLFTRSARSGWYVAIAVPTQAMEAPARRAVAMVGLGLLAAATAGVGVAYLFSRRLTHSITGAMQGAAALGRGEMPVVMPSAVTEIGELNRALADAGTVLANEQEARSRAEAERERLLASEQAARAAAEAQNQAKDEFLAMLGHELRNPLSAISGAVAVMAMSDDNAVLTRHSREVISRQSKHLARIVDDLLDLSRVMTGKIMLHRQRVDLGDAARKCIATLGAAGRSARHEVSIAAEPVLVEADATRLDQIISNLLVNAFKYTPEKGSVAVEVRREGDDAVLVVRDSGIGISAQLLPRVFEIFVQGSATLDRAQGGLGIGLALVHRLVNLHGGSVSAASEGTDRGSTFTVRLPALDSARADETLADAELPAFKAKRLLVVDDHDDARITLCRVLELSGHRVLEGRDGAEGLRIAAAELPDVAIIDIGLPGMDGYEMARQLRAQPATRGIMLIALTGYGLQDDRRRSREAGFDVHLVKPADPERIAAAIAST
ncbi:MAG: integral rane sensor hybrid histidine kinase, partial [Betaproteobacteria bacterium]|nr:integral rane sensor hybrid histidine kinase [Betaproteobacteria bacterium]